MVTSCTCTLVPEAGQWSESRIPAHGAVRLPVRFRVPATEGNVRRDIVLLYRFVGKADPKRGEQTLRLQLAADVIPDYRISPKELDLGEIDLLHAAQSTGKVRIWPEGESRLTIQRVATTSEWIRADVCAPREGSGRYEIEVTVAPPSLAEGGLLTGDVLVYTDSRCAPRAHIPVRANFVVPAWAEPRAVVIGSDETGQVRRLLRVRSQKESRIRAVRVTQGGIVPRYDGQRISKEHSIAIDVASTPSGLEGQLVFDVEILFGPTERVVWPLSVPIHRLISEATGRKGQSHEMNWLAERDDVGHGPGRTGGVGRRELGVRAAVPGAQSE